jgi:glycosyltransferase involved in cell wall biosynthesis
MLSVVVASYNRSALLPRLVDALAAQRGVDSLEMVIVDDASPDDTWSTLQDLAGGGDIELRVLRHDRNRGAAAARNTGWRAARGERVLFTDDDCVPEPDWAATLAAAGETVDIVQGRTIADPAQDANFGPFSLSVDVRAERWTYETCNISYPRALLEKLDGFDEGFRYPYGEDIDLAWRAKESGATTTFVADAVVRHDVRPSSFRFYMRDLRRRDGLVRAVALHPALRANLFHRLFNRRTHAPALASLAAAGVLMARPTSVVRWAVAVAAGSRYALTVRRTRRGPKPRWKWVEVVPLMFAADMCEMAILARASARYGAIVL